MGIARVQCPMKVHLSVRAVLEATVDDVVLRVVQLRSSVSAVRVRAVTILGAQHTNI